MSSNNAGASLAPPKRTGSIKRTSSDLSRELAQRDLPEPEFLRSREDNEAAQRKLDAVEGRLANLQREDEPEGASLAVWSVQRASLQGST